MTFFGLDTKLQGRCRESRKLANNTYAKRRYSGQIAIQLHATDILTFHSDGQIDVNTGGWNTVTTHSRMNAYLPGPWRVGGHRGSTLLYKTPLYKMHPQAWTPVAVICRSLTIEADNTVKGGDSVKELFETIRLEDNRRKSLRNRLKYWVEKARAHQPGKLTIAQIAQEENSQIRSVKIAAYGMERYFLESGAETVQTDGEYSLLRIKLDQWNDMTCLKMVCPSTGAAYVCPVEPRTQTIDQALDFMFNVKDYRQQLVAES
jgi:hypothetical protein